MSWITFSHAGRSKSGKTEIWIVHPKDNPHATLGMISWYSPWRKYVFSPAPGTVFEEDCLRTIAEFVEAQTRQHKQPAYSGG